MDFLLRLLDQSVITLDAKLRVTGINPSALVFFQIEGFVHGEKWPALVRHCIIDKSVPLDRPDKLLSGAMERSGSTSLRIGGQNKRVYYRVGSKPDDDKVAYIVVIRDTTPITELYEADHRLSTAIEHVNESIVITDIHGDIEYVNPAFTRNTGYSRQEVSGKNPRILKSGEHPKKFYKDLWKTLLSGKVWEGVFINKRKEGNLYYDKASISPVFNDRGEITNYVSVKQDITESKLAEERLQTSEAKIRAILRTVGEGLVVVGRDSIIRFVNQELMNIFGYKKGQLVGKKIELLMPKNMRAPHRKGMRRYIKSGESRILGRRVQFEGLRRNGEIFPIDIKINETWVDKVEDRFFTASIRDISDRKKSEEALRESEERFRTLSEAAFEGIAITEKGMFVEVNQSFAKMFGYKSSALVGKDVMELVAPQERQAVQRKRNQDMETIIYESYGLRKNGEIFPVGTQGIKTTYRNRTARVTAVRDISERKNAENELREAAETLKKINEFKDKMISIISHDLRSPLTSNIGLMELCLKSTVDPLSERQEKIISVMRRSADHQLKLVENLVELSRIRRGSMSIKPEPCDAMSILKESVSMLRQKADQKGVRLKVRHCPDIIISLDREKMTQVINNLLTNAIKFTKSKGKVTVYAKEKKKSVEIVVEDTGVGVAPDRIDSLFDLSEKTTTFGTDGETGTGLGLSICQEITALHGGRIVFTSKPGKGTKVALIFEKEDSQKKA